MTAENAIIDALQHIEEDYDKAEFTLFSCEAETVVEGIDRFIVSYEAGNEIDWADAIRLIIEYWTLTRSE